MASIYERDESPFLHVSYKDAEGKWVKKKTPFRKDDPQQRKEAELFAEQLEERIAKGSVVPKEHSVTSYLKKWAATRTSKETGKDDVRRIQDYVVPSLGHMLMRDVTSADIYDLVSHLKTRLRSPDLGVWTKDEKKVIRLKEKAEGKLAAASIRNIYGAVRVMFAHAAGIDRIITVSPVSVPPHHLPAEETDATEIFALPEVEALMSHVNIPDWRRVYYALSYFTATRVGETTALTWSSIVECDPMAKINVTRSFRPNGTEKATKTGVKRRLPLHPLLAAVLTDWHANGFERYVGRKPEDHDLIVPNSEGNMRSHPRVWQHLQKDLKTIGAQPHEVHALRTTFISTLRFAGVDKEVIRVMTHGVKASRDVLDRNYTHWDSPAGWTALCNAVEKLWPVVQPEKFPQSFHSEDRQTAKLPDWLAKSKSKMVGEEGVEPPTRCV